MAYARGLVETGKGLFAWLQPDGSWGWSNAGLIVDGDQSLLVDTLFDVPLTAEMLAAMRDATGLGGADITCLVNTHANGDHTHGNCLCSNAEIIASAASAREMEGFGAHQMAAMKSAGASGALGTTAGAYDDWHEGKDPAGITTQDPELFKRFDPILGGRRLKNYLKVMTLEAQTIARACGKNHLHNLEPEDLCSLTIEAAAMAGVPLAGTNWIPGRNGGW